MKYLYWVQDRLNSLSAHPLSFAVASFFLGAWVSAYFLSKQTFDPGLGIGNLIINGLGLLLMFASCAISARAEKALHDRADRLHDHINEVNSGG